jgi:hypothetical protein
MNWSHGIVLALALIAGLILGVKAPAMVTKYSGGLIAA